MGFLVYYFCLVLLEIVYWNVGKKEIEKYNELYILVIYRKIFKCLWNSLLLLGKYENMCIGKIFYLFVVLSNL